ncbi:DUF998 domain-containing protein [Dactylosporangium sp. AC04546]|uniref:DUF998 domain-containing protein n=1 Tax=Dactylosporangium sp. AC04546 TaxID=2862460 RepID=UPI001EE057A1|nr:DUF998 domain-containing protein [Dactylosporangium sp. AC04546]WVK85973.1 DUF998 domain-containing protein [Dactylosporangium sp. AC04546]
MSTLAVCTPAQRVTRSLLGYGVIAGPVYVTVALTQALTRDGFDLTRDAWSTLALGPLGWIQTLNFVLAGLMSAAFAVGLGRALPGARWAPRLAAVYAASLLAAAAFEADPTPATGETATVSWHGMLHLVAGAVGFAAFAIAMFAVGKRLLPAYSRATGVVLLAGFACVATGGGAVWANLAFTAAIVLTWTWMSVVAVKLYKTV